MQEETAGMWEVEKADGLEETQGESPRKHPRGVSPFSASVTSSSASDTEVTMDPRLSIR